MMVVGNLWLNSPKKRHSVERLRVVYTDLLQHIDANPDEQRRRASIEDVECHKRRSAFPFDAAFSLCQAAAAVTVDLVAA